MGIKKEKKQKEEYVFDQDDFDKYVEYCKKSNLDNLKPPIKKIYKDYLTSLGIKMLIITKRMCLIHESWLIIYFLYIHYGEGYSLSFSFLGIIIPALIILFTHILTLRKLRLEKKYERNKIKEYENIYINEYTIWIEKLKKKYIVHKKKLFLEYQKEQRVLERKNKRSKISKNIQDIVIPVIKYWIPSWIYFIMRIVDNEIKYVGQSINLDKRKNDHAYHKYPKKEFKLLPIEKADLSEIDAREKFWIDRFGIKNLDNKQPGGSYITRRKGFKKPEPIIYVTPTLDELEIIEKWLRITDNKNKK